MNIRGILTAALFALVFSGSTPLAAQTDEDAGMRKRSKERGWLGVSIQDMTPRLARSMDSDTDAGALVTEVSDDSPAEKAGLREEDIIVDYGGRKIGDAEDLSDAVRRSTPGSTVSIGLVRKNQRSTLQVVPGSRPEQRTAVVIPPIAPHPPLFSRSGVRGLRLRELGEQLAGYLQVPDKRGVLVEEVEEGSKAEKAGFRAGDVISKIGKDAVEDVRDVRRALNRYDDDEKVDIEIVRKGDRQKLTVLAEDLGPERGRRYYFKGSPHSGWWNDDDLHEFEFDMNDLRPDLDELRLNLDRLQNDIRIDLRGLRHSLREHIPVIIRERLRSASEC